MNQARQSLSGATGNLKNYEDRIVRNPAVCGGEPVFKGTRVTLRTILASLADGDSAEEILKDFPALKLEDVQAAKNRPVPSDIILAWASKYIETLQRGGLVKFRPRGNSMSGKIDSGQLVTVTPVGQRDILKIGDIVICKINGIRYCIW